MTSNSAAWGGAVYAVDDSTVTATDCTMTSNSADGVAQSPQWRLHRHRNGLYDDLKLCFLGWSSLRRRRLHRHRNGLHDDLKLCFLGWRSLRRRLHRHRNKLYDDLKLCC